VGGIDPYKLIPADGVYAITATTAHGEHDGMMGIGVRPTGVTGGQRTIEAHLFDFNADIYGEPITLHLRHRLRDEMRFDGLDTLKAEMAKDRANALRVLANDRHA
jgi:riboflavin kinase/FMN adenylyltransferase